MFICKFICSMSNYCYFLVGEVSILTSHSYFPYKGNVLANSTKSKSMQVVIKGMKTGWFKNRDFWTNLWPNHFWYYCKKRQTKQKIKNRDSKAEALASYQDIEVMNAVPTLKHLWIQRVSTSVRIRAALRWLCYFHLKEQKSQLQPCRVLWSNIFQSLASVLCCCQRMSGVCSNSCQLLCWKRWR